VNYSPLCDVNLVAYLTYLGVSYNARVSGIAGAIDGDVGGRTGDCGSDNVGGAFARLFGDVCGAARYAGLVVARDGSVDGGFGGVGGDSDVESVRDAIPVAGVAVGNAGAVDGGVGDGGCRGGDSRSEPGGAQRGVAAQCVQSELSDGEVLTVLREVSGESKTERNRRWRREKKDKKKRRQGAQLSAAVRSKDWNADKLVSKRMGYFSECPAGVQEELRNTRAELMIARNKHDKVLVEKKMEELDSSVRLVERTLKVLRLQKDLAKASEKTNMRVGGWAKTVLTDASEEYVNKAASRPGSSLPSLDSIPVETVPTVQSDRDFELRMANYKLAIVALDKEADGVSWCDNQEYLRARNAIDMEYADVALTGEERIKRQVVEKVMEVFGADVTRDQMSRLAEAGLYDENLISYF